MWQAIFRFTDAVFINLDPLYGAIPVDQSAMFEPTETKTEIPVHGIKAEEEDKEEELTETPTHEEKSVLLRHLFQSNSNIDEAKNSVNETNTNQNRNPRTKPTRVETDKTSPIKNFPRISLHTLNGSKSKKAPFTCSSCKASIYSSFLLKHHICKKRKKC